MKLSERIDGLILLREQKRGLETKVAELEKQISTLQRELQEAMDEAGTSIARGDLGTATITEEVVPTVVDWEALYEWIKENDAFYLLHRRMTSQPYRELLDSGTEVPGVQPFTKRNVSLRNQ